MLALVLACPGECVAPTVDSMARHAPALTYVRFPAIVPEEVASMEQRHGIQWVYPDYGVATLYGLRCHAYKGDKMKRRAVFWSHFCAWVQCVALDHPVVVLESDAIFVRDFDPAELEGCPFGLVALNDPRGATRKAKEYHAALQAAHQFGSAVVEVPWVDDTDVPQGTPGASAYWLTPKFAFQLVAKAKEIGARPNDCLTIRQFFPGEIGCVTSYATETSGRPSTLS